MNEEIQVARRRLLKAMLATGATTALAGCSSGSLFRRFTEAGLPDHLGQGPVDMRPWARYPEKADLIMLADRPPLLETPMHYFKTDLTPNDAYFVRWHYAGLPTHVDLRTFRLNFMGAVKTPLQLSFQDLLTKFEPVSATVFSQCAGNSRSFFRPQVPGAEWTNGAMGNAHYKGVLLRDVLKMAGVQGNAVEASFRGLDEPPLQSSPHFEKPLTIDHALQGDAMIAYEMNGAPMPMLNGFPIRLVVPGWFATYWVKALSQITLRTEPLDNFWVKTAYRIPVTPGFTEDPKHPTETTTPLTNYPTRAIFVSPEAGGKLHKGSPCIVEGIAVDDGAGIRRVEVSTDGGRTWGDAQLDAVIDKYSWRRWKARWTPTETGTATLKCRATNANGETQPDYEWNHGGYRRRVVESLAVEVV
ncbi:molybdopterin-dependent oxidoreductase [Terriglobus roseus]|jgi:sulfite dehydrogenase|uniref:Sulfite dehydrogenase (Cytochrome) subunit SorA apoprotein n=1 Tax=Terriglobus roseus TaxID=392734 RepID=A0A1H4W3S0_9BACT|nr:molybdopterin-dependent oxidoreductase [Terriglobus roseus]SEC87873.1 sulfite dehydrogenase (cytochrome) subunit SorA apoprotein [Terriglobus roseus]